MSHHSVVYLKPIQYVCQMQLKNKYKWENIYAVIRGQFRVHLSILHVGIFKTKKH